MPPCSANWLTGTLTTGSKTESFIVTGGYVEVRDNHVRVLADGVE